MRRSTIVIAVLAVVGALLIGGIALAENAQNGQPGCRGFRHGRMMGMMARKLQLTKEQRQQARTIFTDAKTQAKAVFTPEQIQAMQQRREQFHQRFANLTADQKTKLKAIHQDARAKAKAIREDAKLTDTQKQEQFKALRQSVREQIQQIVPAPQGAGAQRPNLTEEQKTKLRSIRDDAIAKFRAMLTPAQQAQFDTMRKAHESHEPVK